MATKKSARERHDRTCLSSPQQSASSQGSHTSSLRFSCFEIHFENTATALSRSFLSGCEKYLPMALEGSCAPDDFASCPLPPRHGLTRIRSTHANTQHAQSTLPPARPMPRRIQLDSAVRTQPTWMRCLPVRPSPHQPRRAAPQQASSCLSCPFFTAGLPRRLRRCARVRPHGRRSVY
jgi:hypothetical protein